MEENPEEEQLEAIVPDEELELEENLDDTEDVEALKADLAKAREAQRQLTARAKRAEDALKAKASQPEPKKQTKPTQPASPQNVEETVLLANGMPEDLLEELKAVASVRNIGLIKAQNDPIFVAVKEKFEKDKKAEAASMGASRGSGTVKPKKTFNTPGLTEEEHREMVKNLNL